MLSVESFAFEAMPPSPTSRKLMIAAAELRDAVDRLDFDLPVTHVYNPLRYAWLAHETYLRRFATGPRRVLFLGMNPGPYGMAQTGVPFGELNAVRDWMGIDKPVNRPADEHPARPVEGFACARSEVSGRRLWGLFAQRFPDATDFFREHFVVNYCPLAFMEASGRNRTPDKLPAHEVEPLYTVCDEHLRRVVEALKPEWLIGVGGFAEQRFRKLFAGAGLGIGTILHPSPASPAANRGWGQAAMKQLQTLGVW
jgi:single-strand selective monofunctional uracil DNA glycosylase